MSVLDQFRDAEQRVARRLKELEPMVAEYRELEQVARRLGIDGERASADVPDNARRAARARRKSTSTAQAKVRAGAPLTPARSRRRTNASPGQRTEQLLALVRERPGVTVAEAGKELGVDPTSLYRVVHRLEQRGDVRKNGRQLEPAGRDG